MEKGPKVVVMYGAAWCPDVAMARRYLDRHRSTTSTSMSTVILRPTRRCSS